MFAENLKNQPRKILLQNENGPCPLLAAANALLLSAQITLPPASVRNNVASIDDVVNMLAGHALKRHVDNQNLNSTAPGAGDHEDANAAATAHHIDELLKLFPSLQHGMDVNPKFTLGPTGCEYTNGLGAFDIMGVDLVHGWLVDVQQDGDVASVIGSKSYNELVEIVINGKEAMEKADELRKKVNEMLVENQGGHESEVQIQDEAKVENSEGNETNVTDTNELQNIQQQLEAMNDSANKGLIIEQFLDTTSHQLTYTGLMELHSHVKEGHLCVFFRNNHFATLTKNEGVLYLLVTDLGYAGVKEVIWEKLDDISGDTELYDGYFRKSNVANIDPVAGGPNLTPEQLLAQRGQSEADFQLALELSRSGQEVNNNSLADREGDLIAAATELSLQEYNHQGNATVANLNASATPNTNPTEGHINQSNNEISGAANQEALAHDLQMQMNEARDREVAMRLQAELNAAGTYNTADSTSTRRQTLEVAHETRRRMDNRDSGCFIC